MRRPSAKGAEYGLARQGSVERVSSAGGRGDGTSLLCPHDQRTPSAAGS